LTDITIILDASTSMAADANRTRAAINEFISGQKQTPGECRLSLITFSAPERRWYRSSVVDELTGWYKKVWNNLPIQEINSLSQESYLPSGNTALWDACAKA